MKKKKINYHHGDLRRVLIEEATTLIAEQGVQHVTLRELAQRVGVSHAAPYRHFADKQALLAAVAEAGFHMLHSCLQAKADQTEVSALARLQNTGLAYVMFAAEHPHSFRILFSEHVANKEAYPSLQQIAAKTFQVLVDVIVACQTEGSIGPGEPFSYALTLWCSVHGLAHLWNENQIVLHGTEQKISLQEWAWAVMEKLRFGFQGVSIP